MRSKLTEPQKEALRQKLVAVLLEVRGAYLRGGASPLKHWDQIRDRLRAAVRQSGTVEQMLTSLCRHLHLQAPSSSLSSKILALVAEVEALQCDAAYLQLVEEEEVYLLAEMRAQADDRREQRAREATVDPETGEVTP